MMKFCLFVTFLVLGIVFTSAAPQDTGNDGCDNGNDGCNDNGGGNDNAGGGNGNTGGDNGNYDNGNEETNPGGGDNGYDNTNGGGNIGNDCGYQGCGGSEYAPAPRCNTDERDAEFPNKHKKYTFFHLGKTWYEADRYCKSQCMALATVMSQRDQHYLEGVVPTDGAHAWLGGKCDTDRSCRWQNTQSYINSYYKNWARGDPKTQPDGPFGAKFNCLVFHSSKQEWFTGMCNERKPFVCQSFED